MIFEFGPYRIDMDVDRTRQWYETEPTVSQCCDCDGCVNYERAADLFPESVVSFFSAMGADVKKPIEAYVNCANRDRRTLWYGGWWHLCGALLEAGEDQDDWPAIARGVPFGPRGFCVAFKGREDMVQKNCPRPVLQMEMFADIPWVLEKENPYEVFDD